MFDFVAVRTSTKSSSRGGIETITIYPEFLVGPSEDLMVRGGGFYAVWDEEAGMWSRDPAIVMERIDRDILDKRNEFPDSVNIELKLLRNFSSKKWSEFLSYTASLPDRYVELDSSLTFLNSPVKREDYISHKLPYDLKSGSYNAFDELIGILYDPIERQKLEWAIGAVVSGDSKHIDKFLVLYGSAGTGKSTMLNILQMLFEGYYNIFNAKALTSTSNAFAMESFKMNPLVSIQHDGDLSRIEDNTLLNSLVSHEELEINQKHKSVYTARINSFLFLGTNKPVKITDAKSGIVRRLIDVQPSGETIPYERYKILMAQIRFELGAIAAHCLDVYLELGGEDAYDTYRPTRMIGATNDFFNFVEDHYEVFSGCGEEGVPLSQIWALYKKWCEDSAVKYPLSRRGVKEEMKNYFNGYRERIRDSNGNYKRCIYTDFDDTKFYNAPIEHTRMVQLDISDDQSIFDRVYSDAPAQLATSEGKPSMRWSSVKTTLSDIDTRQLHYVKVPENHIVIDFDIRDESGEKNLDKNIKAAAKFPSTYTEISQSGKGVHLHYIYDGDISKLSNIYSDGIEIKTFKGNSSLRRKLTRCNSLPIATISSGLPEKKGGARVVNFEGLKNEKALRTLIEKNLRKEIHPGTKPSVDFIYKILCDAYNSGMSYDVTDMRPDIMAFASNSSNHGLYCIKLVNKMPFHSDEPSEIEEQIGDDLIFYDVEVFPNLFVVVWKQDGDYTPVRLINPGPTEIEDLVKFKLVGFNCRRYDNHILYARLLGYSNSELYSLSQKIISGSANCMFREAYNLSYADVYDFSTKKQSLKKFEIELGIHHQELGLPWDQPVDESMWVKVADYCINDVIATEAVFHARHDDFVAREILAKLSGRCINDTTRMHMTRILFGNDRNPQDKFVYTDLSEMFPGYSFSNGKSTYRGEDPGEGGYVYAEPGMYENVEVYDVVSMHPTSLDLLNYFGPYMDNFRELLKTRVAIKHGDHKTARKAFGGKLEEFLDDPDISDSKLAYALKIGINSIYGYTKASFDCEFRDPRNVDNIVAKRGALFMIDLKHAVQEFGYSVVHIKTDSIKIPNADDKVRDFIFAFGKKYGYTFEIESRYSKMCLVNQAVYIAKNSDDGSWSATGAQFAVPYVFKTLFSKEDIVFKDLCETKTVTGDWSIFLDMNEDESTISAENKAIENPKNSVEYHNHNYRFVGKAGAFCPIQIGKGGGLLVKTNNGKNYYAVSGTKGYRWLESEIVKTLEKEDDIDLRYYDTLVEDAKKTIEQFGTYSDFVKEP